MSARFPLSRVLAHGDRTRTVWKVAVMTARGTAEESKGNHRSTSRLPLGDHKAVGGGVWEARLPIGPGYRLYFARDGRMIILLLLGGSKASQAKDIRRAQQFWMDYLEVRRHGAAQ